MGVGKEFKREFLFYRTEKSAECFKIINRQPAEVNRREIILSDISLG